ncbi:MAG TPA: stage II sporulation protein R [Bacillota bacterium]|nr:stage II sporulation protein R [Bacillota bacterium]
MNRLSGLRWLIVLALLSASATAAGIDHRRRTVAAWNPDNLVRLHVVAHSEAYPDEQAKLAVRNAVLKHYAGRIPAAPQAAAGLIRRELDRVEALARDTLRSQDLAYGARADWTVEQFPPGAYGEVVLPGGAYRAVRLVLGSGRGGNWWCVLFPPLCFLEVAGADPSLTPEELARRLEGQPVAVRSWLWDRVSRLARRWPSWTRWREAAQPAPVDGH